MVKGKKLVLTNKSSRVFDTVEGRFHPGMSMEFDEKDAIKLLGYSGEIIKADGTINKIVVEKDKEIAKLKAENVKLRQGSI